MFDLGEMISRGCSSAHPCRTTLRTLKLRFGFACWVRTWYFERCATSSKYGKRPNMPCIMDGFRNITRAHAIATCCRLPTTVSGPTCDGGIPGIQHKTICCPASCGSCGGDGCSKRDGGDEFTGSEACCHKGVKSLERVCSDDVGAPCEIES